MARPTERRSRAGAPFALPALILAHPHAHDDRVAARLPRQERRGIDLPTARVDVRGLAAIDRRPGARGRPRVDGRRRGRALRHAAGGPAPGAGRDGVERRDGRHRAVGPASRAGAARAAPGGPTREVAVWNHVVPAHDAGDAAAVLLSAWLDRDVRLVRFDRAHRRWCNPDYAGDSGAHTAFADGYPILVIGRGSLDDLNARLAARGRPALPMNRFRPNLVVAGLAAARRGSPGGDRVRRRRHQAGQALRPLPDHDHRPGQREGRRRTAGDAVRLPDERPLRRRHLRHERDRRRGRRVAAARPAPRSASSTRSERARRGVDRRQPSRGEVCAGVSPSASTG